MTTTINAVGAAAMLALSIVLAACGNADTSAPTTPTYDPGLVMLAALEDGWNDETPAEQRMTCAAFYRNPDALIDGRLGKEHPDASIVRLFLTNACAANG